MKQRFLNQKLGKRMSRKAEFVKAKAALPPAGPSWRAAQSSPPTKKVRAAQGPTAPEKDR
jgi:hypothetical protein